MNLACLISILEKEVPNLSYIRIFFLTFLKFIFWELGKYYLNVKKHSTMQFRNWCSQNRTLDLIKKIFFNCIRLLHLRKTIALWKTESLTVWYELFKKIQKTLEVCKINEDKGMSEQPTYLIKTKSTININMKLDSITWLFNTTNAQAMGKTQKSKVKKWAKLKHLLVNITTYFICTIIAVTRIRI